MQKIKCFIEKMPYTEVLTIIYPGTFFLQVFFPACSIILFQTFPSRETEFSFLAGKIHFSPQNHLNIPGNDVYLEVVIRLQKHFTLSKGD
jgi:hypothetical protein